MQNIPLDFDIQTIENIEQLVEVLGYIRGKNFKVTIKEGGTLPKGVRTYVEKLQGKYNLEPNGEVNKETILLINKLLTEKKAKDPQYGVSMIVEGEDVIEGELDDTSNNSDVTVDALDYVVSGMILNSSWQGVAGVRVKVFEKLLRNGEALLGEANTREDGHYQVSYNVPMDEATGNPKDPFHLIVKVYDLKGTETDSRTFFKATDAIEANFTAGNWSYQGTSIFEKNKDLLEKSLGGELTLLTIEESAKNQDVTFLYADTGMVKDEIMKMALAHRISEALSAYEKLSPAIIYAFLYQNAPQNLPSYLLPINLNDWNSWLETIVPELTKGIVFTNPVVQQSILNKATARNILPIESLLNLDAIIEELQRARLDYALNEAVLENKVALNDLLTLTSISEDLRPSISRAFSERLLLDQQFMQEVEGLEGIDASMLQELEQASLYAKMAGYYAPAMQVLYDNVQPLPEEGQDLNPSLIYRLSDYAKWTKEQWTNFVETSGIALPKDIYIEDIAEKQAVYAELLYQKAQAEFPAIALLADVGRSDAHALKNVPEIAKFLDDTPSYNLKTTHIDVLVKEDPTILSPEAVQEIKVLKRLSAIAPTAAVGTALLKQEIYSAGQVYAMGEQQLGQALAVHGVPGAVANQVFNESANKYAEALSLASAYSFNQQGPKAIINLTAEIDKAGSPMNNLVSGLPDLESLFGSVDYCACEHCKSVYSPAAYFTDLLRFITTKPAVDGSDVKEVLLARRPDLDDIKLNCENAHKPLPYIDLVCEVLENGMKGLLSGTSSEDFAHNTTFRKEDLKALPEYLRLDAYKRLAQHAPMNNHFNLWLAEAHLFLAHLGVPYHKLMKAWQIANAPDDVSIAAAYFEIYTNEKDWILTSLASSPQPLSDIWDQIQNDEMDVSQFLERSKLTYDQLIELLQLEFINPSNSLTIIDRPINSCAIKDQKLKHHLSDDKMDRIHRFLRLWRNTDWELWELDLLIINNRIGSGLIDGSALVKLQQFHELQQDLGLSVEELLAFYGNMDTRVLRDAANKVIEPFYSRLFLNPAIDHPNVDQFSIDEVTNSPNALFKEDSYSVAAALGVNETVVFDLLPAIGGPSSATGIETLSSVYRLVTLAQKMGLSVANLSKLISLSNVGNVFSSIEQTRELLAYKAKIDRANLPIEVLDYLLKPNASLLEISDATITKYLVKQRIAKKELKDDLFNTVEPSKDVLRRHLAKVPVFENQSTLERAIKLIFVEGTWIPSGPVVSGPIGSFPTPLPVFSTFINTHFDFVRDINEALDILDPATLNTATLSDKKAYVLGELDYYLSRVLVQSEVTENSDLSEDIVNLLLDLSNSSGTKLLAVLRDENLDVVTTSIDYVNYSAAFEAYRLLHKMSILVEAWTLTALELNGFIHHYNNNDLRFLRLNALPIQASNPSVLANDLLDQLLAWSQFVELDRKYTIEGGLSIQHIWEAQNLSDLVADLSKWAGWEASLLEEIVGGSVLNLSLTDFYAIESYQRVQVCLEQQQRLGVQVPLIREWIHRDGTAATTTMNATFTYQEGISNQIKKAAKSKYTKETWLGILKPIQDVLRIQKRDALIQHFLAPGQSFDNTNDLFQHYLIDVEMSPCQMTSRLKQAISSVQLFVQRCMMNLEAEVIVVNPDSDIDNNWKQWKWMQNYRVWEANRKVFLYPENWIEPELRDDKSPFFEELENDLLQKEITHDNVTEAFGRYLQKVDQVAHIDVMGMCSGVGPNEESLKHVLGRTKEIPGNYFFRTFNEDAKTWTAWEAVDVDIKGEHAIPFVYNNKVHIFWLEIMERPIETKMLPVAKESTEPSAAPGSVPVLEIQLAWTVQKTEGWSPKTVSSKKLLHPWPRPHFSLHLRPRYRALTQELWMDVFVSSSREFNDKEFYDQYTGDFSRLANSPFDETKRPWHSSSFVFDGRVQAVKLLGLSGDYYLLDDVGNNVTNNNLTPLEITDVFYQYGSTFIINTNYGTYYYLSISDNSLVLLNQKIKDTRYNNFSVINITSISNYSSGIRIETQNHGNFSSSDLTPLNGLIANDVLAPIQFNSINVNGATYSVSVDTNYGEITDSLILNMSTLCLDLNSQNINNKIAQTKGGVLDVDIKSFVVGLNLMEVERGVIPIPELISFSLTNLETFNNLIATGDTTRGITTIVSSTTVNSDDTDSLTYLQTNFGANGRYLEPLGNDVTGDIEAVDGMHYEFNHWKNNEGNNNQLNIPFIQGYSLPLLNGAKAPFKAVIPIERTTSDPMFYQDEKRAFFIRFLGFLPEEGFRFYPFYHPYTDTFISQLSKGGIDNLLTRDLQLNPSDYYDNGYQFSDYQPNQYVRSTSSTDVVDFSLEGTYASYNWEIFFHIPLLIATNLSKNQRFEEAMQWFHYIFNPTNTEQIAGASGAQQYWMTKPFFELERDDYQANHINTILNNIDSYTDEVREWKNNPFQPHLIARYRPVAYQRNVIMKYIDNLIAWGDQLFRRETLESINQATMLYVLAHELLGDRPEELAAVPITDKTYSELEGAGIDYFGNAEVLVAAEGLITSGTNSTATISTPLPVFTTQYFCIPFNEKLAGYWDLVEDRLFKIRHCMNIEGVVRQLPLFAPPIDPALLVNATAAGLDLGSVLDNLSAPRSNYKFRTLNVKAVQFCSEVKSLGQSLLSALQASDSEGMALLQSANAIGLLESITSLKELQIEEHKEHIKSIELSRVSAIIRKDFYTNREYMNKEEALALTLGRLSMVSDVASTVLSTIASNVSSIPDSTIGVAGFAASPVSLIDVPGGKKIAQSLSLASDVISRTGNILQKESGLVNQKGSYKRRQEEWDLQAKLAGKEIEQIDQQIAASKIRLAIAEKDLSSHALQIVHRETEEAYLKSKYTNKELYSWMSTQVSTIYFQAYQLAYDMAKRAENSFRYELAVPQSASPYIKFGYWDSLKKGLLSGDKLMLAIHKMEAAYLEQNKRMYELTKQISLRKLAPAQLLELKLTGSCNLEIPEWWFDMDYPGHYLRRIKSMSISVPCVVGPHTNVNCTLTLEQNKVRHKAIVEGSYDAIGNYTVDYGAVESIATSHAQNDSGLFELNFNDERYLPFEGAGVISRWKLSLPEIEQFDYSSITDVVLTVRYCSKEGGNILKTEALDHTKTILNRLNDTNQPTILMSLKQEFGTAWHRFVNPLAGVAGNKLDFELKEKHYPFFTKFGSTRNIVGCSLYVLTKEGTTQTYEMGITTASGAILNPTVSGSTDTKQSVDVSTFSNDEIGNWSMELMSGSSITANDIEDIIMTIEYEVDL